MQSHTTINDAKTCYDNRPCDFRDADDQTKSEFARRLIENSGMSVTRRALILAIVRLINKNE